jgi:hypothetical protein
MQPAFVSSSLHRLGMVQQLSQLTPKQHPNNPTIVQIQCTVTTSQLTSQTHMGHDVQYFLSILE